MGAPREYFRSTTLAAPLAQGVLKRRWRGWGGVGDLARSLEFAGRVTGVSFGTEAKSRPKGAT
jgi:hypothetical protein